MPLKRKWQVEPFSGRASRPVGVLQCSHEDWAAKQEDQGRGFDVSVCAICLETFAAGDLVDGLPCGHAFHAPCMHRWLQRASGKLACPLCRVST